MTADGSLQTMNKAGLNMIEAESLEQVRGLKVLPLVSEEYRNAFEELTQDVFKGHSRTLEFKMIGLQGHQLWLYTHAVPLLNKNDEIVSALAITTDITERKQAEEKIRQSEEFIRSILDTVDEGFIVIDRDYRIVTANKAYCSQVGGCDETIIGRHCYEISHKTSRPCYEEGEECATHLAFETGKPHSALHRHEDAKGNILYVETKAYPIKNDSGIVTSVIETINNITEKYLLEEERLKSQKLESIGTLAGGIAHDFNNLLQGIFGYISMAKITHDQKEKSLAMLEQAEEALHMSVNLTTQLLTFSKGGKPVKKLIRLEPTIENAVKFALSGSHTDHRLDIISDLWTVEADAGQLAQVIQNIVLNANEAMAGRGTVNVSVRNLDIPSKADPRLPKGGQFILIDIQDTGTGITEQNIAKIFDPYFTTKQKGSGLGLATSYSIIKNHGGLIKVKSEVNRGTTFSIYLPASRSAKVETVLPAVSAPVGTKRLRILLMDDEDIVRNVAKELIAALGHEVEGAEEGRRAIDLFQQARETGRPFDLIILDLTIKGGMGGEEAIANILAIDPKVRAVVSSGYADSPVVANYREYGFSGVLNKPYKLAALKNCSDLFVS
ncbi:MAG: PAS domain S-box protein [Nitrospirota bacterium]|nr:PAS domain S-box protein [Nitrospirota bacterium]